MVRQVARVSRRRQLRAPAAGARLAREAYRRASAPTTRFGPFAAHAARGGDRARRELDRPPARGAVRSRRLDKALSNACGAAFVGEALAILRLSGSATRASAGDPCTLQLELARRRPSTSRRHTVGLLDPADRIRPRVDPPTVCPSTLEGASRATASDFKLKLGGDVDADLGRLLTHRRGARRRAPDASSRSTATSSTRQSRQRCVGLWQAVRGSRAARLRAHLLLEQPLPRERSRSTIRSRAARRSRPVLIDESDATLDAFRRAPRAGYSGISSKGLQGHLQVVLNALRAPVERSATGALFPVGRGPDLPGRTGGAAGPRARRAPRHHARRAQRPSLRRRLRSRGGRRAEAFAAAHPDLYESADGECASRFATAALDSWHASRRDGFASAALPRWRIEP